MNWTYWLSQFALALGCIAFGFAVGRGTATAFFIPPQPHDGQVFNDTSRPVYLSVEAGPDKFILPPGAGLYFPK